MISKIDNFKNSMIYAWAGLRHVYLSQSSFRWQILASLITILVSFYFGLTKQEWVIVLFLIALVLILEILNTVVEALVDILKPKIHHYVKLIKDLMAATVLVASLLALIVGLLIFIPYIWSMLAE